VSNPSLETEAIVVRETQAGHAILQDTKTDELYFCTNYGSNPAPKLGDKLRFIPRPKPEGAKSTTLRSVPGKRMIVKPAPAKRLMGTVTERGPDFCIIQGDNEFFLADVEACDWDLPLVDEQVTFVGVLGTDRTELSRATEVREI
jgi:hypothetical protein